MQKCCARCVTMQLSTCDMVAARVPQGNCGDERSMQLIGGSRLRIPQGVRAETSTLYSTSVVVAEPIIRLHLIYLWKQGCVLGLKGTKTMSDVGHDSARINDFSRVMPRLVAKCSLKINASTCNKPLQGLVFHRTLPSSTEE